MKKIIVVIAAVALSFGARAQSPDEGIKMYKYERYETARHTLEPLAAGNAMANYYMGLSQIGLGDLDGAQATFSKYPADPANMAGMARVAFSRKNAADGAKIAENVASMAKKKNWEPLLYAADAITYTDGGDLTDAIAWYKKALETVPDNESVRLGLGDAYREMARQGKINSSGEAMNSYEKIVAKNPANSLAYSRIGSLWYAASNYELALENYAKAKEADPKNPLPYRDLANAFHRSGNLKKAKDNIEEYRKLSDTHDKVEEQYLDILYLAGDYENAIRQADELIKQGNPPNPRFYGIVAYSELERANGDSVKALEYVKKYFAAQKPEKIGYTDYLNYGKIALKNKMDDLANENFAKYEQLDTTANKVAGIRSIAQAFRDAKSYAKAADWYGKLASNEKASATDYFYWGFYNYVNSYNIPTAQSAFEQFETKFPDQPTAPLWRGKVAAAIDSTVQTGAAITHYEKWLAIADNDKYTKKKNDLMGAYQYLATYYYNKNDKANMRKYLAEIEKLEPDNSLLKQLRDYEKNMK